VQETSLDINMISRRQFLLSSIATTAGVAAAGCGRRVVKNEGAKSVCDTDGCYYTRMFPKLARTPPVPNLVVEQGLADLGQAMTDRDSIQANPNGMALAGYTYLGQFIDHDLTLDITPLESAYPEAECIRNFRTPFLNLDHVYGGGPTVSPFLYEISGPPGNERFLIGMTLKHGGFEPTPDDLPRNSNGIALTGDPRQDENLIIAQLHVAFLKFHNRVMDELEKLDKGERSKVQSAGPVGGTRFERARRFVTWSYQYIVLNDFLEEVIDPQTLKDVQRKCAEGVGGGPRHFEIPIEFSAAAFRFGHSMVRDLYGFYNHERHHDDVGLACLLALIGPGTDDKACAEQGLPRRPIPFVLPADWVIDWSHFFNLNNPKLNHARKIDTMIAEGLHHLKLETMAQFNTTLVDKFQQFESPKNVLPVRTLWRGSRMGLPSGQDVAGALHIEKPLTDDEIQKGLHEKILTKYGFHKDTPLWYYILKEAELERFGNGLHLGPVGSHIVAEVIADALLADPNSYVSIEPKWKPVIEGCNPVQLMRDILRFIFSKS
jgi:Animal haem peroxidase/TAT (twin-arginine translocation) pathway signal sequence